MDPFPPVATYGRDQCAIIHRSKDRFGPLSNMHGGFPLVVDGVAYGTSEALYQAQRFPHRPDLQDLVIGARGAWAAKQVSILYQAETRADWEMVRVNVMLWCLRTKLAQHRGLLCPLLVSTSPMPIVELSYRDGFWGAQPQPENPTQLIGRNALGRAWMELREAAAG